MPTETSPTTTTVAPVTTPAAPAGGTATPPPATTPATTTPAAPTTLKVPSFYEGYQDHGVDDVTMAAILKRDWKHPAATGKSFLELEKALGRRNDDYVQRPKADDPESVSAFWKAAGVPDTDDGYEITVSDEPGAAEEAKALKALGRKHNMPKAAFEGFLKDVDELATKREADRLETVKAQTGEAEKALQKKLGGAYKEFVGIADFASRKLGLTNEQHTMAQVMFGYEATMNLLHTLGNAMREDGSYNAPTDGGGSKTLMPAEAQAELDSLLADNKFYDAWAEGKPKERRQADALVAAGAVPR